MLQSLVNQVIKRSEQIDFNSVSCTNCMILKTLVQKDTLINGKYMRHLSKKFTDYTLSDVGFLC